MKIYSAIIVIFFNIQVFGQDVIINEFMSSNNSVIQDFEGNYSDWIELYNKSSEEINLLNFSLSDDIEDSRKWILPQITIKPNDYLIIFASGTDKISGTEVHTNFKIKQSGEPLILTNSMGSILSLIEPVVIPSDKSFACIVDGNENMNISNTPTPNSSNNSFVGIYCSHSSGFYKNSLNITLSTSNTNSKIYYTLNGEDPSVNSKLYNAPIPIKNNQQTPLNFSLIPTTPLSGEDQLYDFIWKKPKNVYKCNVLRYAVLESDTLKGVIYTKSFFVDNEIENRYSFPVISIVTDSLNIFDYNTGIYVPGKRFDENGFNWWPEGNYHNRGEQWERNMYISYFENKGLLVFETNAGLRMRGYGSASNPQKSFTTYFRKKYGISKIEHTIFKNSNAKKFKRLIFRNSGNDFINSHFKDAMLQKIIEDMDLELQAFQPSIVFLNGEYWGIHNIREKYDKFYFKFKFGIKENDINILSICGNIEEGDNSSYNDLISFVKNNDLSKTVNYNHVASKLDLKNFIDFQIAEIYLANYDWPCNNFKIWKDNNPNSKWRFLIYDLDLSFGNDASSGYNTKSMEHATSNANNWPHCKCSNLLFRSLLKNEYFKNQFLDRFIYCLKNTFETNKVTTIIDEFESMYSPEIADHIDRWNYPSSVNSWRENIDKLREFATERPCYMSANIISYFKLKTYGFDCSLKNLQEKDILVLLPNPNNGDFTIINNSTKDIENGKVNIVNSLGQIIYFQEKISINAKERYHFQLKNFSNGMYLVVFSSEHLSITKKIILSSSI